MFAGLFRSSQSASTGADKPSAGSSQKSPQGGQAPQSEAASRKPKKAAGKAPETGRKAKGAPPPDPPEEAAPPSAPGKKLSKRQKKAARRKEAGEAAGAEPPPAARPEPPLPSAGAFKQAPASKAMERLKGSRFRWLNDTLYHIPGQEAKALYDKDPSLAEVYHEGFRAQAAKWPCNPLDDVIKWLRTKVPGKSIIGDFGCGEARLAATLSDRTVHSFDLVAVNERVTACNIAEVPLADASLDVAVFCLSLMGVDWLDFLTEARRCLRDTGLLHVVEVESRFENINSLISSIEALGFRRLFSRKAHGYFVEMRFACSEVKAGKKRKGGAGDGAALLKGCKYRRR